MRQEQVGTRWKRCNGKWTTVCRLEAETVTAAAALKQRIADLTERLAAADARARAGATATPPGLDGLESAQNQLAARVDDLVARRRHDDGRLNARLERLNCGPARSNFPAPGAIGIHLASYRELDNAVAGWDLLRTKYGADLIAFTPEYLAVETVGGSFVRLIIGPARGAPISSRWLPGRAGGDYAMIMPVPRDALRVEAAPASNPARAASVRRRRTGASPMRMRAAVLRDIAAPSPYADSQPIQIEEVDRHRPARARCWCASPAPAFAIPTCR